MSTFYEKLRRQWEAGKFVCVGLDPVLGKIPGYNLNQSVEEFIFRFNVAIIDATADIVCAYKPNTAFYEGYGLEGLSALFRTIAHIKLNYPEVVVIYDAKRGDIGNTNNGYAKAAFQYLKADAITVSPYLGGKSLEPFLESTEKGIIVLCKTSNEDSGELQDPLTLVKWQEYYEITSGLSAEDLTSRGFYEGDGCWIVINELGVLMPACHRLALRINNFWNGNKNCALVTGGTYPNDIAKLRFLAPEIALLIPGIGTQGGDVEKTVKAGVDKNGAGFVINSSSGIIHASSEADFAEVAREKTIKLGNLINLYR
jgi:orotidine-5'-phosphate decarboxylase